MDLNAIIFPSPNFEFSIEDFDKELIFIAKKKDKNIDGYIPCLLLQAKLKSLSKYFLIFFHGNAEDIFIARDIAEKIKDHLYVR